MEPGEGHRRDGGRRLAGVSFLPSLLPRPVPACRCRKGCAVPDQVRGREPGPRLGPCPRSLQRTICPSVCEPPTSSPARNLQGRTVPCSDLPPRLGKRRRGGADVTVFTARRTGVVSAGRPVGTPSWSPGGRHGEQASGADDPPRQNLLCPRDDLQGHPEPRVLAPSRCGRVCPPALEQTVIPFTSRLNDAHRHGTYRCRAIFSLAKAASSCGLLLSGHSLAVRDGRHPLPTGGHVTPAALLPRLELLLDRCVHDRHRRCVRCHEPGQKNSELRSDVRPGEEKSNETFSGFFTDFHRSCDADCQADDRADKILSEHAG